MEPVAAPFPRCNTLASLVSTDNKPVTVPVRTPTVTIPRLLPIAMLPVRHCNEVSDSHIVDQHTLPPSRTVALCTLTPMLWPCTVTLADPDAATL